MTGDGPPLLLVHGFGISFDIWKDLVPLLRPHFTLVMVELPGIGKSPMFGGSYLASCVDGLEGLRLSLGIEKWNVLGYSTGSRVAEAYARMYAPHVSQTIFLCPMFVGTPMILLLRFGLWMDGYLPALGNWLLRGWRLRFLISLFGFNLIPDPHAGEWYALIGEVPVNVLKETLKMVAKLGLDPFSAPPPFSFIRGETDIIPAKPRRPQSYDHFVRSNHAAPAIAADEVSALIIRLLSASDIVSGK